eukprot:gnl/Chilomastix_caulleri/7079.p3 GENE.gnl/Chilomastix_caulleri/7079~~gnl/Chilomastix_caulleri/7079.p3  ORF type:complete len:52 (-),score=8.59 gnl/Chilomastix_caulleri/7079:65-220(-)
MYKEYVGYSYGKRTLRLAMNDFKELGWAFPIAIINFDDSKKSKSIKGVIDG